LPKHGTCRPNTLHFAETPTAIAKRSVRAFTIKRNQLQTFAMTAIELKELKDEINKRKAYHSPFQLRAYRKLYRKMKKKILQTPPTTTKQLKLL
jgi:hypothetical protein